MDDIGQKNDEEVVNVENGDDRQEIISNLKMIVEEKIKIRDEEISKLKKELTEYKEGERKQGLNRDHCYHYHHHWEVFKDYFDATLMSCFRSCLTIK